MSGSPDRPVLNLDEVVLEERAAFFQPAGEARQRFDSRVGPLGARLGARMLGYNVTAVPPGKRAFPLHNHHANEEMFLILQGSGELRRGSTRHALRVGDVIACPPGGPDSAHQIVNTGETELRFLAVSTMITPELVEYPDSNKFAAISRQPAADGGVRVLRHVTRQGDAVDYWEGE